jgi:hypothetical protein
MPTDVTSDDLATIFNVHVADILLRPGYQLNSHVTSNDQLESEAWIKRVGDRQATEALASKTSGTNLRGFQIHCDVVHDPLNIAELCRNFEKGICDYPQEKCNFKHITCHEPDTCENKKCWYGHNKRRQTASIKRPFQGKEPS